MSTEDGAAASKAAVALGLEAWREKVVAFSVEAVVAQMGMEERAREEEEGRVQEKEEVDRVAPLGQAAALRATVVAAVVLAAPAAAVEAPPEECRVAVDVEVEELVMEGCWAAVVTVVAVTVPVALVRGEGEALAVG